MALAPSSALQKVLDRHLEVRRGCASHTSLDNFQQILLNGGVSLPSDSVQLTTLPFPKHEKQHGHAFSEFLADRWD